MNLKNIYTYGGFPAKRNLTVADIIALRGVRKMTMVAAGVAMGSGSPLIGWLRSSGSIGLLKHAFEQVRSGKSTQRPKRLICDFVSSSRKQAANAKRCRIQQKPALKFHPFCPTT